MATLLNYSADSIKEDTSLVLGHTRGLFDDMDLSAGSGALLDDVVAALDKILSRLRCGSHTDPQEAMLKMGRKFDRMIEQGMKRGNGTTVALPSSTKCTLNDSLTGITDLRVKFLREAGPDLILNDAPGLKRIVERAGIRGETSVTSADPRVGMEILRMLESRRLHIWLLASGLEKITFAPSAAAPRTLEISARLFSDSILPITFSIKADEDHSHTYDTSDEQFGIRAFAELYEPIARGKLCDVLGLDDLESVWKGLMAAPSSLLLALGYQPRPAAKKDGFFVHVPSKNPDLEDYRNQLLTAVKLMESEGFVYVEHDSMKSKTEFAGSRECGPQTLKEYNRRFPTGVWGNGLTGRCWHVVEGERIPPQLAEIVPYLQSKGFMYDQGEWLWPGRR